MSHLIFVFKNSCITVSSKLCLMQSLMILNSCASGLIKFMITFSFEVSYSVDGFSMSFSNFSSLSVEVSSLSFGSNMLQCERICSRSWEISQWSICWIVLKGYYLFVALITSYYGCYCWQVMFHSRHDCSSQIFFYNRKASYQCYQFSSSLISFNQVNNMLQKSMASLTSSSSQCSLSFISNNLSNSQSIDFFSTSSATHSSSNLPCVRQNSSYIQLFDKKDLDMAKFDSLNESFKDLAECCWNYSKENNSLKLILYDGFIFSIFSMIYLMLLGTLSFLNSRGCLQMLLSTSPACLPVQGRLFLSLYPCLSALLSQLNIRYNTNPNDQMSDFSVYVDFNGVFSYSYVGIDIYSSSGDENNGVPTKVLSYFQSWSLEVPKSAIFTVLSLIRRFEGLMSRCKMFFQYMNLMPATIWAKYNVSRSFRLSSSGSSIRRSSRVPCSQSSMIMKRLFP